MAWTLRREPRRRTGVMLLALMASGSAGAMEVLFTQADLVTVTGEVAVLGVEASVDAGEQLDLFSFGIRLIPEAGSSLMVERIAVPPALDFSGFVDGALASHADLGVKGNVALNTPELQGYDGSLLAEFLVRFDQGGVWTVGLDLYRTAGPNEDVFVTTSGASLDESLTFGTAVVHVIERPVLSVHRGSEAGMVEFSFEAIEGLRYTVQQLEGAELWRSVTSVDGAGQRVTLPWPIGATETAIFRLEVSAGS